MPLHRTGMTQALKGRGGICASVIENGTLRVGDEIEVDPVPPTKVS
jgi:MOSC domain-containing protein YiiM